MCREWERETKTCLLYACALHWPSNYALHKWMKNVFTKKKPTPNVWFNSVKKRDSIHEIENYGSQS